MIHPNTLNEIAAAYEERLDALRQQLAECRRNTLLEAAEVAEVTTCGGFGSLIIKEVIADELRRMAEE